MTKFRHTPEQHQALREATLTALVEAAGDKPGHLAYLEALIVWHDTGAPQGLEPVWDRFPGLSWARSCDLEADVAQAYTRQEEVMSYPPPTLYLEARRRAAERQAAAAKTREVGAQAGEGRNNSTLAARFAFLRRPRH